MAQPHSEDEGPSAEAERRAAQMRSDEHSVAGAPPGIAMRPFT
ncbi:Uncharacterised protein [Mycobacteroides abscessus subsp. abscessus]|nr:Uncharacterised protein [Mycobacteroides abscessus subsp. abscessus]